MAEQVAARRLAHPDPRRCCSRRSAATAAVGETPGRRRLPRIPGRPRRSPLRSRGAPTRHRRQGRDHRATGPARRTSDRLAVPGRSRRPGGCARAGAAARPLGHRSSPGGTARTTWASWCSPPTRTPRRARTGGGCAGCRTPFRSAVSHLTALVGVTADQVRTRIDELVALLDARAADSSRSRPRPGRDGRRRRARRRGRAATYAGGGAPARRRPAAGHPSAVLRQRPGVTAGRVPGHRRSAGIAAARPRPGRRDVRGRGARRGGRTVGAPPVPSTGPAA